MPSAILRSAYSTTTIAASTSMPEARIRLNSTTMFIVMLSAPMARMPVRKEAGIAMPTSRPERRPKVATQTTSTRMTAAITLFSRSATRVRMVFDLSRE